MNFEYLVEYFSIHFQNENELNGNENGCFDGLFKVNFLVISFFFHFDFNIFRAKIFDSTMEIMKP